MKLFVWNDVLYDYGPGLAVVLAENVSAARTLAKAQLAEQEGCYCCPDKNGHVDREDLCRPCVEASDFDVAPTEYPADVGVAFLKRGSA